MTSTARSYAPSRRYEHVPAPRIEVHQGQGTKIGSQQKSLVTLFKIAATLMVLITVVAIGRVWLTNASMDILTQTSIVNNQIEEARTAGSSLEAQYYALANPNRVKDYASNTLGMAAAASPTAVIDLTPDAVKNTVPNVVATMENDYAQMVADNSAAAAASQQAAQAQAQVSAARGDYTSLNVNNSATAHEAAATDTSAQSTQHTR